MSFVKNKFDIIPNFYIQSVTENPSGNTEQTGGPAVIDTTKR